MHWTPPYDQSSASQTYSFAYESTIKRWPTIITGIVNELAEANYRETDEAKIVEAKTIISKLSELIHDIKSDKELDALADVAFPHDVSEYNTYLEEYKAREGAALTWFKATWLFAECYLYRKIRNFIASTSLFKTYDPFFVQKTSVFRSSGEGVAALAQTIETLVQKGPATDVEVLRRDWISMLEICLWGNATDLSLLTTLTESDIKQLQSIERGESFVLRNDFGASWECIREEKGGRLDIVLDNSGFELYSDLVLADWLVTLSPFISKVTFHPKLVPWFVSDVLPSDFTSLIELLLSDNFFEGLDHTATKNIHAMASRWKKYIEEGTFELYVPESVTLGTEDSTELSPEVAARLEETAFWTTPYAFADMRPMAPSLVDYFAKSSLVIFKGDLNYRKLTGDAWWPATTPFSTAIGPLAGEFNLLSLRTLKADVCVGLPEGVAERLDKEDKTWRSSGKYAVVSFEPRKA